MVLYKLSKIDQQYPRSILLLFVVLFESKYDQHNYFLYYRPFHCRPIHFKSVIKKRSKYLWEISFDMSDHE